MAINIKIGSSSGGDQELEAPKGVPGKPENLHKLNIRKSVDGKLMIFSHQLLDLVIDQKNSKLLIMSTEDKVDDKVYDSQNRLMRYLTKKGIIDPATVKMSNIYGVLEGTILTPENPGVNRYDILLLNVSRWLDSEEPGAIGAEKRRDERVSDLTDPEDDESTELGKVKHRDRQGSGGGFPGMGGMGQSFA